MAKTRLSKSVRKSKSVRRHSRTGPNIQEINPRVNTTHIHVANLFCQNMFDAIFSPIYFIYMGHMHLSLRYTDEAQPVRIKSFAGIRSCEVSSPAKDKQWPSSRTKHFPSARSRSQICCFSRKSYSTRKNIFIM